MTVHVDITDPAATLASVVDKARLGEEVVLTEGGAPVARIVSLPSRRTGSRPPPGLYADRIKVGPKMFEPTDEEILKDFGV